MQINNQKQFKDRDQARMRDAMTALAFDLTKEAHQAVTNQRKDSRQNRFMRLLTTPSRCCRTCRTQRRLASIVHRSINIAVNKHR